MDSNESGRRRFLKQAAALAGVAAGAGAGAEWAARGQSAKSELSAKDPAKEARIHGEPSRRGVRRNINHITYFTPLQDYAGIITPAPLHFVQLHTSYLPDIDPQQHRLTIHGLVDRPLSFTLEELKRAPSVSRIHFVECQANGAPMGHDNGNENMGLPVQYVWGMMSCSEWTGVPLSVTIVWDYINRAMPASNPGSLTPDEVYSVVAFLFYQNGIIQESDVLDAKTLPKVEMPNRDGFVPAVPVYPPDPKKPSWY
jgi:DMSO/TMAO reductase YedYZ molybdopterin-dependent catalytic subunit